MLAHQKYALQAFSKPGLFCSTFVQLYLATKCEGCWYLDTQTLHGQGLLSNHSIWNNEITHHIMQIMPNLFLRSFKWFTTVYYNCNIVHRYHKSSTKWISWKAEIKCYTLVQLAWNANNIVLILIFRIVVNITLGSFDNTVTSMAD